MKKIIFAALFSILTSVSVFSQGLEVGNFSTFDTAGNTVTQDIFTRSRATVFIVWATFNTESLKLLPEYAKWQKELPTDVQMVGLVADLKSGKATANIAETNKIMQNAGVNFVNMAAKKDLKKFLENIQVLPTVYIVDRLGNVIGEPVAGGNIESCKQSLKSALK